MTDLTVFREYEPTELGRDGYPRVWHDMGRGEPLIWSEDGLDVECWDDRRPVLYGVKHLVRAQASDCCVRCGHPYAVGAGGYTEAATEDEAIALTPQFPEAPEQLWGSLSDPDQVALADRFPKGERPINWSPCGVDCTHAGPVRWRSPDSEWFIADESVPIEAITAGRTHAFLQGWEFEAAWRILTVHHLNGRKHDLRWWNLASLCQRCHLTIQRKVVMERLYPFEHSTWFKPYAAAWYAYAYLGENLTREQAVERQDELLALERMV